MAGLLTYPFLLCLLRTILGSNDFLQKACFMGLTAAGTVPDSHRIPFYPCSVKEPGTISSAKLRIKIRNGKLKIKKF